MSVASTIRAALAGRLSAVTGGLSGGLGAFGALHNVCHYTCELVVGGLALVGISLAGLPLAFLEDPRLIVLFGSVGLISTGLSMALHLATRRRAPDVAGLRRLVDRRAVLLMAFLTLSGWSVAQGTLRLVASATAAEGPSRSSKEGNAEVQLTLLNLKDSSLKDGLVFELAVSSMDMAAPSFETVDFKRAVTLEVDGGRPVPASEARISEWGHMGHHVRGQLRFPVSLDAVRGRGLRVTVRGLGGVERRVLEWRIPER